MLHLCRCPCPAQDCLAECGPAAAQAQVLECMRQRLPGKSLAQLRAYWGWHKEAGRLRSAVVQLQKGAGRGLAGLYVWGSFSKLRDGCAGLCVQGLCVGLAGGSEGERVHVGLAGRSEGERVHVGLAVRIEGEWVHAPAGGLGWVDGGGECGVAAGTFVLSGRVAALSSCHYLGLKANIAPL